MRGQAAFDYMLIAAFSLAMIIPVFYYAVTYSYDSITTAQAQDAVNTISKAADNTYSLGVGSLSKVRVDLPQGIINDTVGPYVISFTVRTTSGVSDIVSVTKSTVSGSLPTAAGSYNIVLNNTGPFVNVSRE